jgi:Mor family transcriptional regulator
MKIRSQQIRRRNTMLAELAEMLTDVLTRNGIAADQAANEAEDLAFEIHRRWAGLTFTFPVNDVIARKRMELYVVTEYDGTNAETLMRKYGVTEDRIYSIVRQYNAKKGDEKQFRMSFDTL